MARETNTRLIDLREDMQQRFRSVAAELSIRTAKSLSQQIR